MTRVRRRRRFGLWLLVSLTGLVFLYGVILYATLSLPRGEDRPSLKIYSAPYVLTTGMGIERSVLQDRLTHLGYRSVSRKVQAPGEYRSSTDAIDLFPRSFHSAEGLVRGRPVRLVLEDHRLAAVLAVPTDEDAGPVMLEPQLIGGLVETSRQVRDWIPLSEIPPSVVDAVLAIEDHRFYQHLGIDPIGIARAAWYNVKGRSVVQGGSTITQQLAKNLYYTQQRTFFRKLREAAAALILERKYTKRDILESYLNEIYLGQAGSVAVYGVGQAAHYYFGKPLSHVTVSEAALLAGMIKGPNTYAPVRNAKGSKQRRDLVLLRMKQEGRLTEKQYHAAVAAPIRTAALQHGIADAPYFVDYLLARLDEHVEGSNRLHLFTTLDLEMQRAAEQAVTSGLARLERMHKTLRTSEDRLQASLVALDAKTGAILAMVGGRDYRTSQFNHAVQAKRQAGSLFKPFVYLAAFERSLASPAGAITPATLLDDTPLSFPNGHDVSWSPQNFDHQFHGRVSVRTALEQSLNVPVVRVAQVVGVPDVIRVLRSVGLQGPLDEHLSLALGTSDVSLLEMTAAYGTLARGGEYVAPLGLTAVAEHAGSGRPRLLLHSTPEAARAFSPQSSYLVTSMLQGVIDRGTASMARTLGLTAPVAGKTGTTDDHRDAWFIGYTPDLIVGVWVGFDEGTTLRLTGAQAALPIWIDFFRKASARVDGEFAVPAGVVLRTIDPDTAQLATTACPHSAEEWFIEGTEPTLFCEVHSPGMIERLKEMFGL